MIRKFKRGLGIGLISISLVILLFNLTPTGAVVGVGFSASLNLIALITFILGLALFLIHSLEINLAKEILSRGGVITNSRELIRIARKMDYGERQVKEGFQVLNEYGKPITVIPNHPNVSPGVSRNVLKALSTGESSFRKYAHG